MGATPDLFRELPMRRLVLPVLLAVVAGCGKAPPPPAPPTPPPPPPAGVPGGNLIPTATDPTRPVATDGAEADPYAWGWLGVQLAELPPDLRQRAHVPDGGALVRGLAEGSLAKDLLRPGDILVKQDGKPIAGPGEFLAGISATTPGAEVHLTVLRDGAEVPAAIKVGSRRCEDSLTHAIASAVAWLVKQQRPDGGWDYPHPSRLAGEATGKPHGAVSALVLAALAGVPADAQAEAKDALDKGLAFLKARISSDGLLTSPLEEGVAYKSYATALTAIAMARRNGPGDKELLVRLVDGLHKSQLTEGRGQSPLDWMYGSWNTYDGQVEYTMRGDVSCASYVLQALYEAGVPADDPALKKVLRFVKKSQNLCDTGVPIPDLDDGGFAFNPRTGKAGFKQAGAQESRNYSYGSATADGVRALYYCVRKKDDPRVHAGLAWLARNWSVDFNPGFDRGGAPPAVRFDQGIYFYYLHSLAAALDAAGSGETLMVKGGSRYWAVEILSRVCRLQRKDGDWRNAVEVMNEDDPNVSTALCLLTLDVCARHVK